MPFITRIAPSPAEVTLVAETEGVVISFFASWRKTRCVGFIQGIQQGGGDFLISDLKVENDVLICRTPFLPFEKRANFRRLGIGKKLLHEFVNFATHNRAARIYGSVVSGDLDANTDLLNWYRREGFTVREPDEKCLRNAVAMIEMSPGSGGLNVGEEV